MHLLVFSAFPRQRRMALDIGRHVSMHLLVLSAFRLGMRDAHFDKLNMSQCTFWCSVLSDAAMPDSSSARTGQSQCTFWCSVLSDFMGSVSGTSRRGSVSMHLLVLSAFRLANVADAHVPVQRVSMHLLVLSAFRLRPQKTAPQRRLPERNRRRPGKHHIESARTCPIKPHNREKPPQTTPAPPTAPTSQYATGFQPTQAEKPTFHDYATVNTATKATVDCPCADTTDRFPLTASLGFPLTASLGPTAASRWLPRPGCPPHPADRRPPTVRRFHVNRRPPLAQPRWAG